MKHFLCQAKLFVKMLTHCFRYHVNGVDGEAAILRRDSFMNSYQVIMQYKAVKYVVKYFVLCHKTDYTGY